MDLPEAVRTAGVVGAGGAGFPTHLKLQARVDTVIVNGAECEPLLRVDQELMAAKAEELARALEAVVSCAGAEEGIFALKAKYHAAEAALRRAIGPYARLAVHILDDVYPAGDEHVLVQETTGRTVPAGGIPPQAGAAVVNVETLLNVGRALDGRPVTEKFVTVTGAVAHPGTFSVPVGTSFADLLAMAGGVGLESYGIIDGGPMMGRAVGPDGAVTKTTKGLLVLPAGHPCLIARQVPLRAQIRRAAAACCGCRMCTDLCPRYLLGHPLEPHRSLNAVAHGVSASPEPYAQAYLCSECGVCDVYACPMGLSPRRLHAEMKRQLSAAGVANPFKGREARARRERSWRRIPTVRLLSRLGLSAYNTPAPLDERTFGPARVRLLLAQGAGPALYPAVRPGDYVTRGQCVAAPPDGKLGALLHASIDGRVERVDGAIEITAV